MLSLHKHLFYNLYEASVHESELSIKPNGLERSCMMNRHNKFHKIFIFSLSRVIAFFVFLVLCAIKFALMLIYRVLKVVVEQELAWKVLLILILFYVLRIILPDSNELLAYVELLILVFNLK